MQQAARSANATAAFHEEASLDVAATTDAVFAFIDDPLRLAGHMRERSLAMAGGRMTVSTDAGRGRAPGSRTQLTGRLLGMPLEVETEVVSRDPPHAKEWRTVGHPRLLVIGDYRMNVDIVPTSSGCRATVAIDYELPRGRRSQLALWLARKYARWCVLRMTSDIAAEFARVPSAG